MAKVIITIEDHDESGATAFLTTEFIPELDDEDDFDPTAAQVYAAIAMAAVYKAGVSDKRRKSDGIKN